MLSFLSEATAATLSTLDLFYYLFKARCSDKADNKETVPQSPDDSRIALSSMRDMRSSAKQMLSRPSRSTLLFKIPPH